MTIDGNTYKTFSGNWTANVDDTIDITVSGYTTGSNHVYVYGLTMSKNVDYAIHSDTAANATSSTITIYIHSSTSVGYAAVYALKDSVTSLKITIKALEASTSADPHKLSLTFGSFSPPNNLYECQPTCAEDLNAFIINGVTYPGAFCGASGITIPSLDFSPPTNGVGDFAQSQLNNCSVDPQAGPSAIGQLGDGLIHNHRTLCKRLQLGPSG